MDEKASPLPRPPRALFAGAAAAAGLAAWTIPGASPGLNLSMSSAAAGFAVALGRPSRVSSLSLPLCVSAMILALTPVIRAAGWVIAPNMLFALALSCWALAGTASWIELVKGLTAPLARLPLAPVALAQGLGASPRWFRPERLSSVLKGTAFSATLLLIFGALFSSADAAFARLARTLLPQVELDGWTLVRMAVFVAVFTGAIALVLAGPRFGEPASSRLVGYVVDAVAPQADGRRRLVAVLKPGEWIPALCLTVLLFLAFVGVQFAVLFGGHEHVLATTGLTYAEYARQGFGQLIAASGLTLALLGAGTLGFDRPTRLDSRWFYSLFGGLSIMTIIVLASALHRLGLYESAFGFTRPRLAAHAVAFWLAGIYALIAGCRAMRKMTLLPLALVNFTAVALLGFTLWNPDKQIAERNVDRYRYTGKLDEAYLSTLSADAVGALASLPEEAKGPILRTISARFDRSEPWTSWNLGRARAKTALSERTRNTG